jgi:hypothetical protein
MIAFGTSRRNEWPEFPSGFGVKQTFSIDGNDAIDPNRNSASRSFDHLVGGGEERWRHSEAEHPGSLCVDDQFELRRLHNRQFGRLGALEDAAGIDADLTIRVGQARAVAHQPAGFGIVTQRICSRDRVAHRNSNVTSEASSDIRSQGGGLDKVGSYQRVLHDAKLDAVAGGYTLVCLLTKNNECIIGGVP